MENRISGENISLEVFTDTKCVIRFIEHLWFAVYHRAGHIKTQLTMDEFKALFEHVWKDRALHAGWDISFEYDSSDTILTFVKKHNRDGCSCVSFCSS